MNLASGAEMERTQDWDGRFKLNQGFKISSLKLLGSNTHLSGGVDDVGMWAFPADRQDWDQGQDRNSNQQDWKLGEEEGILIKDMG